MDRFARSLRINLKLAFTLVVSPLAFAGCAHQYLLKLTDGDQLISYSKPRLVETSYHFTDAAGTEYVMPKSRVTKIQSVTVVKKEEEKPAPRPKPPQPKHWYFLWLA